jgi:hypothetical protein
MTEIGFVIDTDTYSGSFVREVCGFVTGMHDETHGQREAEAAREELDDDTAAWMEDNVRFFPEEMEDNGYHRCAHLYPTEGWFNNGVGGHFRDGEEDEALKDYQRKNGGTEERELKKYPAYMSVAIWFREEPPEGIVDLMKDRAQRWAEMPGPDWNPGKPKITGFRVVRKTTTVETEEASV